MNWEAFLCREPYFLEKHGSRSRKVGINFFQLTENAGNLGLSAL